MSLRLKSISLVTLVTFPVLNSHTCLVAAALFNAARGHFYSHRRAQWMVQLHGTTSHVTCRNAVDLNNL